jgi:hypothetical protein
MSKSRELDRLELLHLMKDRAVEIGLGDEYVHLAKTPQAKLEAKVAYTWGALHQGRLTHYTGLSPWDIFEGAPEGLPLALNYRFYGTHIPGLFESVDWASFKEELINNSPEYLPQPVDKPAGFWEAKTTVFVSTNFKCHANHLWLRYLVRGHEEECLFLSPVPHDDTSESAWYEVHGAVYAKPGHIRQLLLEAAEHRKVIIDIDGDTNDMVPVLLKGIPHRHLIGWNSPGAVTTVYDEGFPGYVRRLKMIPTPNKSRSERLLVNAGPIKWPTADVVEVGRAINPFKNGVTFLNADPDSWYVKKILRQCPNADIRFQRKLPMDDYVQCLSDHTHYLEPSGVGTFSCLVDAVAAGLEIIPCAGERSEENQRLLSAVLGGSNECVTPEKFWSGCGT